MVILKPDIDRVIPPQKRQSAIYAHSSSTFVVLAVCASLFLVLLMVMFLVGTTTMTTSPQVLHKHAPILIDSDADFLAQAAKEKWKGAGSESDPYVIENYEIDASGSDDAVYIGNTTLHFVLMNCLLYYGAYDGICLINVTNSTVSNNECYWSEWGIGLGDCWNITVRENICENCTYGLSGSFSFSLIENNSVAFNSYHGIGVLASSNSTVRGNNCSENGFGIDLDACDNVTVESNTLSLNDVGVFVHNTHSCFIWNNTYSNNSVGLDLYEFAYGNEIKGNRFLGLANLEGLRIMYNSRDNIITQNEFIWTGVYWYACTLEDLSSNVVDASNMVNGDPLIVLKDVSGGSVPAAVGQLILLNCTSMNVSHQLLDMTIGGLQLGWCNNITVEDCDLYWDCVFGIYVEHSKDIHLENVTCDESWCQGVIYSVYTDNLTIENCSFAHNQHPWGSSLYAAVTQGIEIADSTMSDSLADGAYIAMGSDLRIVRSNFTGNNGTGIRLYQIQGSFIGGSDVSNNSACGLSIDYFCTDGVIGNNQFFANGEYAISVTNNTSGFMIWNNTFIENNGATSTYDPSHLQCADTGYRANSWDNSEIGNYWSDWTTPDNDNDGIVDSPYVISTEIVDRYPRTTPAPVEVPQIIPEFNTMPLVVIVLMAIIALTENARRCKSR